MQQSRSKYSKLGSGRPVKIRIDETAARDRHKQVINCLSFIVIYLLFQMIIISHDQISDDNLRSKVEQLREFTQIDVDTQLRLWSETFRFRRQTIRDQSTNDVVNLFPAYTNSFLVSKIFTICFFLLHNLLSVVDFRRN